MGHLLRTLAVWALFILIGPLGGLALFLTAGISASGQMPGLPTAQDGQTLSFLIGMAYLLGVGPLFIAGLIAAASSSFIRRGSAWLIVAMLVSTVCMWALIAALMAMGSVFEWRASLVFSLSGTGAGLLAGLLSLPIRPRPRPRAV